MDWLRADLAAWTKLADKTWDLSRICQTLEFWQKDADLAGIRDDKELDKLPADAREVFKKP